MVDASEQTVTVTVQTPVTWRRICDLICTGIEGGYSPWLHTWSRATPVVEEYDGAAYYAPEFWLDGGKYAATFDTADDDEGDGSGRLTVNATALENALNIMAAKYPNHFADFLADNDDAFTGDVFLQCLLLGEVIYG